MLQHEDKSLSLTPCFLKCELFLGSLDFQLTQLQGRRQWSGSLYNKSMKISWMSNIQLMPAVSYRWTVVKQDCDVDAHDGDDAAAVEVHHEEPLECERRDLIVHHFYQAESKHKED